MSSHRSAARLASIRTAALPSLFFFFNDTATTEIYTLSLHDALPISRYRTIHGVALDRFAAGLGDQANEFLAAQRSEEHTSELQSPDHLVCRLLLEKKKTKADNPAGTLSTPDRERRARTE